ncbi:hypothetical protein Hypma_011042 [Hypsizygus marmoreus]|uniref:DUF6533 domain-containing protein n=1 Tax=Hypsizygus marmoreus TaxID=39966 RepID=A0A369JQ73_HYPMA|nr:hypothetical protein Hypma_011042 [Hypsizygus marmoreus]
MMPSPVSVASTMFAVQCVSYSAVAFHVYEWLCSLSFEAGHIWRKGPLSLIKWQYLVSRYLGIIVQIGNTIITSQIHTYERVPKRLCRSWYASQLIAGQCMLLSLEGSLIIRLYALYNRNASMKVFLIMLICLETLTIMICGVLTLREIHWVGACIVVQPPLTVAYIGIAQVVSQSIIWTLTLWKYEAQTIPVLSLVVRDGSFVYMAMFTLLSAFLVNIFISNVKIEASRLYHATFPYVLLSSLHYSFHGFELIYDLNENSVFIAIVTSANCRLIRNMEAMTGTNDVSRSSTGFELSSFISADQESEQ